MPWCFVIGAVLCAIASVCAAYLFPLEADALLMWNLMVLVVHALIAGVVDWGGGLLALLSAIGLGP